MWRFPLPVHVASQPRSSSVASSKAKPRRDERHGFLRPRILEARYTVRDTYECETTSDYPPSQPSLKPFFSIRDSAL
ncbi:unnamed protein product [Clonostachys rosea f. rosea IK726]|uniref:Uncharacterized protein n=1 Tax=Clonostachys rosea f. rosea IK726 TaxID=1349383 RepID=A0ACA9URA7_BIOOC|nr:unnamed protein product [Clonostachys rosea f. rosea IK726]